MKRQTEEKKLFTRRAFILAGVKAFLGIGIISRLIYLQIFKAQHYKLLSDKNRIVTSQTLPPRGNILDCNGEVIATNKHSYSAVLDLLSIPLEARDDSINKLIKYSKLDKEIVEKLANLPRNINRSNRFVLLQENLNWEQLSSFYILSSFVPGINIEKNLSRFYPDPLAFSHIIGYVGAPTKEDIENSDNTTLSLPMAKIGKCCIERSYNQQLFGKSGIKHDEVNSKRHIVRTIDEIKSIPGEDINLTINKELQDYVYHRLSEEQSAVCIVMNVHTGAVLSFVSYPGYDINIFNSRIDKSVLTELYQNPYKPMINKAISGLYSPGSSFKMITGLAALRKGVINKHTKFGCYGVFNIGSYRFHCWRWRYGGHGLLNLQEAISRSCDVYFYNLAMMLSPDEIAEVARDFGLGVPTEIDIPGEKTGLMPTKAWKKKHKKQNWTRGDTLNMSIGQGFTLTTPIQLTRMIAILVNGLKPITPYVCQLKEQISPEKLKYKQEHINIILSGMSDVVNDPTGTAYHSHLNDLRFGGKTGSTQVFRITAKQRREFKTTSDNYWQKEHAIFVGYAPVENPKYAVCVLVEHGGGGASKAAPIARDILWQTVNLFKNA